MSQDNNKLRLAIADKFTNNCQIALSDESICKKILSQCDHYLNSYIKFLVPPQESCCARLGELLKDYNLEFAFPEATHFQAASFGDEESGKDEDEAPTTPLVKAYAPLKFFSLAEIDETQPPVHKKIGFAPSAKEGEDEVDAILTSRAVCPVKSAFFGGATPSSDVVFLPEPPADLRKKTPVTPPIRPIRPKYTTQVSTISQKSNTINLYSCWPPPIGIIMISLLELILFIANEKRAENSGRFSHGIIADYLMFDPYRRKEAWRFLTYHLVHIGTAQQYTSQPRLSKQLKMD